MGAAVLALTAIAGLACLTAGLMQDIAWGIAAAGGLFVALRRFFLPSTYSIDGEGIAVQCAWSRHTCRWCDVRRFLQDRHGGYLSTRARGSAADAFRGVHLLYGDNRDAVVARIEQFLRRKGRTFMHWLKQAFAVAPPESATPTEGQKEAAERFCREIVRRHLATPALIGLESLRPLNFLIAQGLYVLMPFTSVLVNSRSSREFAAFLEQRARSTICATASNSSKATPRSAKAQIAVSSHEAASRSNETDPPHPTDHAR